MSKDEGVHATLSTSLEALPNCRYNIGESQYQQLELLWRLALTGGGFPKEEGTCPPNRKLVVWVACLLAASRNGSAPDHARKALSTWSRSFSTNLAKNAEYKSL
ncbi:hypothetical protein [Microseira sp. BLCC-F43]|jgi:hypothetical protein|uniref:hypothetical protein n=1 Tax=Microseira sp. BLCC-F43 TaxID=3153602 RepID=UPI0035B96E35